MAKYNLIVKGDAVNASNAVIARGFNVFTFMPGTRVDEHFAIVDEDDYPNVNVNRVLACWFCEPPGVPPFPPGTLLFYGEQIRARDITNAIDVAAIAHSNA